MQHLQLNYCIDCTSISKTLLVALKEDMSDNFKWTCNGCKQNFPSLTGMTAQLKSIGDTTNNRLSIIEDKMNEMQHGMSDKIKEEVGVIKPKIVDEIKDEIRATLQEDVRREIREIEDQKIRALNLIVFNLPESEDVSSSIRKDQDLKRFNELCSTIKVQEPDIKLLFRLGNPTPKRNRPLKIIFNNKKQRKDILDNASKIKNIPAKNCLSMCIIAKDLTVQQRDQNKKRRAEKIKQQQKALKEKKTVDNENKPENIDQEMIVDAIAGSQECMDDTAPPSQSQQLLETLLFDNLHAHNIDVNGDHLSLSSLGEETIIGGFDLEQPRRPQAQGPGATTNKE